MNIIEFEADFENAKEEFEADWEKIAWFVMNEHLYGPSEFLAEFGDEGKRFIEKTIESGLHDPETKEEDVRLRDLVNDFFELNGRKNRRKKMNVVLGDLAE